MPNEEGSPLTEEDQFYLQWGLESFQNNIQLANDVLRQLLTLSAALLGSGVYFLSKDVIPIYMIGPVLVLMLVSMIAALLGVLPYSAQVDLNSPTKIKEQKEAALAHKRRLIGWSATPLIVSLVIAGIGVVVK